MYVVQLGCSALWTQLRFQRRLPKLLIRSLLHRYVVDFNIPRILVFGSVHLKLRYPTLQIGNMLGAFAGIIGPIIVSACTESLEEGDLVYSPAYVCTCMYVPV